MNTQAVLVAVLAVVLVLAAFQTIEIENIKAKLTGNSISSISSGTGSIDTTGWTENEIMNYEMHGTVPSRVSGSSSGSGATMVGGC